MNLRQTDNDVISVTLSRRNLNTLLKMLDMKVGYPSLHRLVDSSGTILKVTAEEDAARFGSGKDEMKESAVERTPQHLNSHGIHPLGGLDRERTWARLQYGRIRVTGR